MSHQLKRLGRVTATVALALSGTALAFNSGSTGADGAFNPSVSTQVQLPESGIFNFTTVNIPSGVTVTFKRNTTNTPVIILATGNVTITGTIDLSGTSSTSAGAAGDGNLGDDGVPGSGGAGGYDGGRGGVPVTASSSRGGNGLGPGGGSGGRFGFADSCGATISSGGGGGGFGAVGSSGFTSSSDPSFSGGGVAYGSSQLLPLVGGSGGGGGSGNVGFGGSGGGGGGGAILIASSGTISIVGQILAIGGTSGSASGVGAGATGGGGSGGAIRLLATTISGNGPLNASGGSAGGSQSGCANGGAGAVGRIRLEAENFTRTTGSTPPYPAVTAPTTVFVAGLPTLRITSVAGVSAPALPTGNADILLPANTPNPVTVTFATTGVPVGNTVTLNVVPAAAASVRAVSPALSGSTENATASVNVTLPSGPSVLQATTSYTVVAALGRELGQRYANGEQVERVTLIASVQGPPSVTLTTVSGKQYRIPAAARD